MKNKPRRRGLILGTSHTYGSCEDFVHEPQNRWFGRLYREHDLNVLALPGISNEGLYTYLSQFIKYAWDGERFDFIVVEGRLPNTTSIGRPLHDEHSHFYKTESLDDFVKISKGNQLGKIDSLYLTYSMGSANFDPATLKYKDGYLGTRMQVLHMQAMAISTCVLAETIADKVLFFPAIGFKSLDDDNHQWLLEAFGLLRKTYGPKFLDPEYFHIGYMSAEFRKFEHNLDRRSKFIASCGHLTAEGNATLQKLLSDSLNKELGI